MSETLIAYGFAAVFALFVGLIVAIAMWMDDRRGSTVLLAGGAAAGGFMTLAVTVLDKLIG